MSSTLLSPPTETEQPTASEIKKTTQYTVSVINKLMRDKRFVGPLGHTSDLAVAQIPGGSVNLYYRNQDLAELADLSRVYPDLASPTGWSTSTIVCPGTSLLQIAVGYDKGKPRLFVVCSDGDTTGAVIPATIFELPLDSTGAPGAAVRLGKLSFYNLPGGNTHPKPVFVEDGPYLAWCTSEANPLTNFGFLMGACGAKLDQVFSPHNGTNPVDIPLREDGILTFAAGASWPHASFVASNGYFYGESMDPTPPSPAPYRGLSCDQTSLATVPAGGWDTCLFADGRRIIVEQTAGSKITVLEGHPEPSSPGKIVWDPVATQIDIANGQLTWMTDVQLQPRKDGGVELILRDSYARLWASGRGPNPSDVWEDAIKLSNTAFPTWESFLDDQGDLGIFAVSADLRYFRMLKDEDGDWNVEALEVPGQGTLEDANVYRVGITIVDENNAPVPLTNITVSADDGANFVVAGESRYISKDESFTVQTDKLGCLWVMADITNSLAAPTLTFTSADGIFGSQGSLVVKPEADAQHFVTHVTVDELQKARDESGNALFPSTTDFNLLANKLNSLGQSLAPLYEPASSVRNDVYLKPRLGARLLFPGDNPPTIAKAGYWQLSKSNGVLVHEDLTPQEATRRAQELKSAEAALLASDNGLFGIDWDDVWDSVVDGITSVTKVIINGVEATITFLVDAVERTISTMLDIGARLLDVVTGVLDLFGVALGKALSWVVKAIGWLFNWPDIFEIKRSLKNNVRTTMGQIGKYVDDPANLASKVHQQIASLKSGIDGLIGSYKSSQYGTQNNGHLFPIPTITSILSIGNDPISAQATWLIEKFQSVLPSFMSPIPDMPDLGVAAAGADVASRVMSVISNLESFAADLAVGAFESWVDSISDYQAANLDPVLNVVQTHADALLDDIDGVVNDVCTVGHAAWANPSTIADWMDSTIYVPFFSAFYKGLTDDDFSMLDFVCLVAAIPYAIANGSSASNDGEKDMFWTIYAFNTAKVFTHGLAAAIQEPSGDENPSALDNIVDLINTVIDVTTASLSIAFAKLYDKDKWVSPAIIDLWAALFHLVVHLFRGENVKHRSAVDLVITSLATVLELILAVDKMDFWGVGYLASSTASSLASFVVDTGKVDVNSPAKRIGYVLLQGSLAELNAEFFRQGNQAALPA